MGGQPDVERDAAVDLDAGAGEVLERLAPDVEHGVGADQRVAQRGGLLGVERLGLVAVLGGPEVEVARHAQQLAGRDRRAGAAAAVGDVGLDRAEVPPAVEDDGQRVAQREAGDAQGDGGRGLGVDERPPEQIVGVVVVPMVPRLSGYRPPRRNLHHRAAIQAGSTGGRVRRMGLIYKPFGILSASSPASLGEADLRLRVDEDRRRGAPEATHRGDDVAAPAGRRGGAGRDLPRSRASWSTATARSASAT